MQTQENPTLQEQAVADGVLAQQALSGDAQAFEVLVHRYSTPLFNFIYHMLGDHDLSCDILQQVFLQLYLSLSTLRTGEPLKPWLFQVARNRCLDDIRQRARRRTVHFSDLESGSDDEEMPLLLDIPDCSPLPEELAEQHDIQECLRKAIAALPPKFRDVVFLRYTAQLSFAEIGQTLHMPTATAKTYFQRAKPLLCKQLRGTFDCSLV